MVRKLACVLALIPGLWLASAQALGLGEVDIRSKLNQRFAAVIPVITDSAAEAGSLTVQLASASDFAQAGIERTDYQSTLDFTLSPDHKKIRVNSTQEARTPFLNFIVEVHSNGRRVQREYAVLLEPEGQAPATASPATGKLDVAVPVVTAQAADATATPVIATDGVYGPVQANETLWHIATGLRPKSVTMDQMLLGLYQANPQSFAGGINGLLEGARLKVPEAADLKLVDAAQAKAQVDALRGLTGSAEVVAPVPAVAPDAGNVSTNPPISAVPTPPTSVPSPAAAVAAESTSALVPLPSADPGKTEPLPAPAVPTDPASTATPTPEALPAPLVAGAPGASDHLTGPTLTAPGAAPPASPVTAEDCFAKYQTPLLILLLLLVLMLFVVSRIRRSRTEEAAARGAPRPTPPLAPLQSLDDLIADRSEPPPVSPSPPAQSPPKVADDDDMTRVAPVIAAAVTTTVAEETLYRKPISPQPVPEARPAEPAVEPPVQAALPAPPPPEPVPEPALPEPSPEPTPKSTPEPISETPLAASPPLAAPERLDQASPAESKTIIVPVESKTTIVNADGGDPLTEAGFHLAYGLFDEAAQILKSAIVKDPQRVELQTKLAETYFAAGKPVEFQEAAQGLRERISPDEWQKLADMGHKLRPDAVPFQAATPASAPEPDAAAPPVIAASESPPANRHNIIDFDLGAEAPASAPPAEAMVQPAPQVSLPPVSAPADFAMDDLDLSNFDLDAGGGKFEADHFARVDFHLDELDLARPEDSDADSAPLPPDDESDTKLDLARAYADMGDNEAARSLLAEVILSGSDKQKREAETLHQRLSL